MPFHPLGEIIQKTKKTSKFRRGLERAEVFEITREVIEKLMGFEKHLLEQEMKFEFRGRVLTIRCKNSYLGQEVRFYQEQIKRKIDQKLGGFLVEEIKVKVGR